MFKRFKIGRGGLVGILLLVLLVAFAGASLAIEERTYTLLSGGTKPADGSVQFISYYKGSDNIIQTEDSWNNTTNAGWYFTLGVTRVDSAQIPGLIAADTYDVWITATANSEGGHASGTVGSVSPNYTTPGTSANKLNLAGTNYLATPSGSGAIPGNTRAFLVWAPVTGASGYSIYKRPVPGNANTVYAKAGTSTGTYFMDSGLTNGTTYYYLIVATASGKMSGHTAEIAVTPVASAPTITGISPASGPAGTTGVVISGTGFGADPGATNRGTLTENVRFNGNILDSANVTAWGDTSITITIPLYSDGTYNVTVTNDSKISNNDQTFTIGPPPDGTAPAAITTLAASTGTNAGEVNISWTDVGDDGTTGTATSYILKYSTSAITDGNFDAATTYVQAWTPLIAGTVENKVLTGLTPGATLYFAIKARDEVPNTGAFGNCVSAVVQTGTLPTLTSAAPNSGRRGETLTSVAIVGSNTHFTRSAPTVDFGTGVTHGAVTVTDDTHLSVANVVIASDALLGTHTVSVSVTGPAETATGNIFTVNDSGGPATSVVIDDYEGGSVNPASGYYTFAGTGTATPSATRVTTDVHEGANAMNTTYSAGAPSPNDWRGWGGVLTATQDCSATDTISFWMKGDGSTSIVKIQFKDADGSNFGVLDANAVSLSDTTWREYRIARSTISNRIGTTGDATMDWSKVIEYQFVFTGASASTGVRIDYVVATTAGSGGPHIDTISPASGSSGIAVTLDGSNFGTAGEVRFTRTGVGLYSMRSTDTTIQSYDIRQIILLSPSLQAGTWNVSVYTNNVESNTVTFEVVASQAPADAYNFPNPFNPNQGETTTIVFAPQTSATANIYIFDMTARMQQKILWSGGAARVVWDGKNAYGETVGDGVYLYRIVDGTKLLGRGKILVINK
jgi:hypothetical protein